MWTVLFDHTERPKHDGTAARSILDLGIRHVRHRVVENRVAFTSHNAS
jgi:hypothetical protein